MRIGELARRTGFPRDTIRFYERKGLITSGASPEASNDYRDYPDELLERLDMIGRARAAGLSIADLQRLFHHLDALEEDPEGAERFLEEKMAELRTVIRRSRRLLDMLRQTLVALRRAPRPD